MKSTFINSVDDMSWLFDTHLKENKEFYPEYNSAILYGNEDCPEKIELYKKKNPLVGDFFVLFSLMDDKYVLTN